MTAPGSQEAPAPPTLEAGTARPDSAPVESTIAPAALQTRLPATQSGEPAYAPPPSALPAFDQPIDRAIARGTTPPPSDWRAIGYAGGFGDFNDGTGGGALLGASFQYRAGLFVGGALAEVGGTVFDYTYKGVGLLGGLGLRPTLNTRFEVLGMLGGHFYRGVGRGLLSDDPGAGGSTGYAGGRVAASYIFGRRLGHFELGVYGEFDDDLARQHKVYDYAGTGGLFGEGGTGDHTVGTARLSFGLELGGSHDIL